MEQQKKRGRKPVDPAKRKAAMTIALTPEERNQLQRLADQRGQTTSAVIADLVRTAANELPSRQIARVGSLELSVRPPKQSNNQPKQKAD